MTPQHILDYAFSYMTFLLIGLGVTVATACFTGAYVLITKGMP